jgi:hypothetical protein
LLVYSIAASVPLFVERRILADRNLLNSEFIRIRLAGIGQYRLRTGSIGAYAGPGATRHVGVGVGWISSGSTCPVVVVVVVVCVCVCVRIIARNRRRLPTRSNELY